ncbi:MAG: melibiose carrier protein [Caulobacter sp.]|nr:melibiose carrier protein [Caulobacter sp.]
MRPFKQAFNMTQKQGNAAFMAAERHPGWRLAAFALLSIPLSAMLLPVTMYLPHYYTSDLGMSLGAMTWAYAAVRLFDLVFDPGLGIVMDRVDTRFGRFRPWVVIGTPIAMVGIYMLFMAKPGVTGLYLLFWMIIAMIGQSMGQLGQMAWAAQAAPQYGERARVYGWVQGFTLLGMLIILTLPVVVGKLGGSDVQGVQAMGWLVICLLPPTVLLALFALPEPPVRVSSSRAGWRAYWTMIKRPNVLRLLGVDILLGTAPTLAGTLLFYYFAAVRGIDRDGAAQLLLLFFVGGLAGAPFWPWLARRIGKHKTVMFAAIGFAIMQAGVLISPHGGWGGPLVMFMAGLPFAAFSAQMRAMMADVRDEIRLETGVDQSGMLFSLLTGSIKIGTTVAIFGAFQLLDAVGFKDDPGATNSKLALDTLSYLFALAPAAMGLAAAWLISGHKLTSALHGEIRRKLEERDGAEDAAAPQPLPELSGAPAAVWAAGSPEGILAATTKGDAS